MKIFSKNFHCFVNFSWLIANLFYFLQIIISQHYIHFQFKREQPIKERFSFAIRRQSYWETLLLKFFFSTVFKKFYNVLISQTMKNRFKKIQNIASLETQPTLSDISDSRFKININLPKRITKLAFPAPILQIPTQQAAQIIQSQSYIDMPQLPTNQTDFQPFDDDSYKRLLDCPLIQPITMKKMSQSSRNELQDMNFSLLEIHMPIVQRSSTEVACKQLKSNKRYNEDTNYQIYQQSSNRSQKTNPQMNQQFQEQAQQQSRKNRYERHKFNLFKKIFVDRNQTGMNEKIKKTEVKSTEFKVIPPISKKKIEQIQQSQEIPLHQRELNYVKVRNSVRLKDYLFQNQIASKMKFLKRRQGKDMRRYQKRQLSSSFNPQIVLNPIKKIGEKERKYSVKSSQILQVVKTEILNEFKNCTLNMKKISDQITEIEKWLQLPKDEDLWRIFQLKRSISEEVNNKLCNMREELSNRRVILQKSQRK